MKCDYDEFIIFLVYLVILLWFEFINMQKILAVLMIIIRSHSFGDYIYTEDPPPYHEHQSDGLEDIEENFVQMGHGPYFETSASKNVTALVGKMAYLNCRVKNLGNKTVSWIRHRDLHLLTSGRNTYTSDQRFQSVHNPQTEDWVLRIRFPQHRDSGIYECQIGTTPPMGHSMYLLVVEPITTIVGGPDLYINTGSTLNLTCVVRHSPEPPPHIFWTHDSEEINYDSPRGGVSVITEKGDITTSYLLIQRARAPDSGKYTCSPSNANPRTVIVHVLNGEQPAAIQQGIKLAMEHPIYMLLLSLVVVTMSC